MLRKFKLDSKLIKEIDFGMIVTIILITLIGVVNIYSAVGMGNAEKQFFFLIFSLVCLYFLLLIDYNILENYVVLFYWFNMLLLVLTKFVLGSEINGATGWIKLGPLSFQPSELAKIAMILMLAKKIQDYEGKINNLKNFVITAMYAVIPMGLIVIQPDMGMCMVSFFIALGIFFCVGLDGRIIVAGLFGLAVFIMTVWNSGLIKGYQKRRLISFLNPEGDPSGDGLQVTRALIGIGSGGFFGTGVQFGANAGKGYTDVFVPENHTDMIFSVLGEHWGTIGCIILLALYGILLYKMIKVAKASKDIFGSVIAVGMVSYFLFAILQHIGMNIAIMPITGITLPFMSYGGSSLLTTTLSVGLVINIGMRKKKINF
ncbi:rod shape-determining protein RodA [Inconstantimicrobium mannanitabidum]|uniref:Rod shape-determining protein RodA n=1 Tax=Inconstantimicrobium mannanitabidum TaxID=1604901 RepID=A0ACB5R7V7_9CLOT|nr:rod shape-determining protein RodA [Clostridium sp. TW13]GKX65121.1 rod shape-determining protein RodA [Clostridium sp. TW13]